MDEPNWAKVLHEIYRAENGQVEWPLDADGWEKTLNGTGLSFEDEDEAISFLHELGLLEKVDGNMDRTRRVTKRGFDVAHERELQRERQEVVEEQANIGKITAALTGVLAANAAIQAIQAVINSAPPIQFRLSIIYSVIAGALIAAFYWYLGTPRKRDGRFRKKPFWKR